MKKLLKNWKTTFFGFATIIGGVAKDFDKTGI